jgi:hypothetical protein
MQVPFILFATYFTIVLNPSLIIWRLGQKFSSKWTKFFVLNLIYLRMEGVDILILLILLHIYNNFLIRWIVKVVWVVHKLLARSTWQHFKKKFIFEGDTTGNPGFAEGLKLSAKGIKLSAQARREIFSRPWFFAEHSSSRFSAQPVPRAHSGPSAKKSSH